MWGAVTCSSCGSDNRPNRRFCHACGAALTIACGRCGSLNEPGDAFCGNCGSAIGEESSPQEPRLGTNQSTGTRELAATGGRLGTELRHVSVLFCDLVGFTPLAESKDPEDVREILSGYFDLARAVVSRYGGVIEKFIGDAVMAVWGVPSANEDDAERAVRAGLELVASVGAYGDEHGGSISARVGIVTGGAATTETPEEGLVIGDRVNTAARIQSVAAPGTCYVDDATRRATSRAIVYEEAGEHELKGKSEPVRLHRAVRVVAGVGGASKSEGLEAPFAGRDRELRLVKDLFHASAHDRRAHLVSVTGHAGIGKSRLAWEFYKYVDGISDQFNWHRGRCLSYGDGVAYWALAEMVRSRAGILEGEDSASASNKLHASVCRYVEDAEEQRWVEPRLAHLLGIEERSAREKEDLFAAWRLFFERMADAQPVVLSFEDMQWADASLLDFIEYLLDWSRAHPIFVLTLARPEFVDRRPTWGAGRRNFTSIYLEPLGAAAMTELVTGLVPGLPSEVVDSILARAEGVPLYAVETVRMLIDRGLVVRMGASYQPIGTIGSLDIPETLHALIAARLDGLPAPERGLLQEAAVIGKSFFKFSLAALLPLDETVIDELLLSLVRKEVVSLQTDPRSPELGQYAFLQDLVREVAYEMLPKRDRKDRHVAVAQHLLSAWGGEDGDIVEVAAAHYLDAFHLAPEAADAEEVKAEARRLLVRAGERAAALAVADSAQRYFEMAIDLTEDAKSEAQLHERAGQMAQLNSRTESARAHYEASRGLLEAIHETHASARLSARLGEIDYLEDHLDDGIKRMEAAFALLANDEQDANLAALAAQLGRLHLFAGNKELAAERVEFALGIAERLRLREEFSQALNTKAVLLEFSGRVEEATVLLRHALAVALENNIPSAALRAYNNLAVFVIGLDSFDEAAEVIEASIELARRVGDHGFEEWAVQGKSYLMAEDGRWDEALSLVGEIGLDTKSGASLGRLVGVQTILLNQGKIAEMKKMFAPLLAMETSTEIQTRAAVGLVQGLMLRAEGKDVEALERLSEVVGYEAAIGQGAVILALVAEIEVALKINRTLAEERVAGLERRMPGDTRPLLEAQSLRFRAALDRDRAQECYTEAEARFRALNRPFWLAVTLLEHAEWLHSQEGSEAVAPLIDEAAAIFTGLGARPWLERLDALDEFARLSG